MGTMTLPPGFRFHPTDDELVGYYLKRKVDNLKIELEVIPVIDLYKSEPWELPGVYIFIHTRVPKKKGKPFDLPLDVLVVASCPIVILTSQKQVKNKSKMAEINTKEHVRRISPGIARDHQ